MKEFKDINKRYTTSLSKSKSVSLPRCYIALTLRYNLKMSDMANNDLEKYAKALDKSVSFTIAPSRRSYLCICYSVQS